MNPLERFMAKVHKLPSGCWQWLGKIQPNGYARFAIRHATHAYAHRWIFEHERGSITPGLDLDHLCRNRWCVNPDHLEAVSRRENLLRGDTIPARHAVKTHCSKGHAYDEANTYLYRGMRYCKECRRDRYRGKVVALPVLFLE